REAAKRISIRARGSRLVRTRKIEVIELNGKISRRRRRCLGGVSYAEACDCGSSDVRHGMARGRYIGTTVHKFPSLARAAATRVAIALRSRRDGRLHNSSGIELVE